METLISGQCNVSFSNVRPLLSSDKYERGIYAISGVYRAISSPPSGACLYIGSSNNLYKRWACGHKPLLDNGHHPNVKLQSAWDAHKEDGFSVYVLEKCDEASLISREQAWIDFYKDSFSEKALYNISFEAGRPPPLTEEQRAKIAKLGSERWGGDKNPMFQSERFGQKNPFHGRVHSEETKKKISEKARDRYRQDPSSNPFFGKKHSKKARKKMRNMRIGKTHSEETKRKISEIVSGRANPSARSSPVKQIDARSGSLIKIWSHALAVKKALGIDNGSIARCCDGKLDSKGRKCLTAGGFRWERCSVKEYEDYCSANQ